MSMSWTERRARGPLLAQAGAVVRLVAILAVFVIACGSREDGALPLVSEGPLTDVVASYVADGRTEAAFSTLAVALADASVGNPALADAAELRLLGLAAVLAETARSRPLSEQVHAHALTVWPALLAEPLTRTDDRTDARTGVTPVAGESAADYLARLCAGPLWSECGAVVPAQHAVIVRAIAMRNANERMREALATCLACRTRDHEWDRLGWKWESLDREAAGAYANLRRAKNTVSIVTR